MSIRKCALVCAVLLCGCGNENRSVSDSPNGGTIVIGASADPGPLFPPASRITESQAASELVYEYLADVGPAMNTLGDSGFVKELASGWKWSADSSSIAFSLNPLARWHDGANVTSRDVAFTFAVNRDPSLGGDAASLSDIDSVSTPDSATAVFWFNRRTPQQFYKAASQMLILPSHLLGAVRHDSLAAFMAEHEAIGTGRFRPGKWEKGSRFELVAVDSHYRGRAKPDRIIWSVANDYQSSITQLMGGVTDVYPYLRPETVGQVAEGGKFNVVSLPGMDYAFMSFNLRKPLFASREMRRALTMALDRQAMVKNLFDTLAAVPVGPTVRAYATTDTSIVQIPFDTASAARILDSLGWKRGADGMRRRNGQPLQFTLIVPSTSRARVGIAPLIQAQLRKAGVEMQVEQMDFSAFGDRWSSHDFDAALGSWHENSAPGAIRGTWTTAATGKDGSNYGNYRNPVFDAQVDSALSAPDIPSSRGFFKRALQTIVDDAPAIWLYEPRTVLGIQSRIHTTPFRPSAWWLDVANWSIPASNRIERDLIQAQKR
jgi:peptide/nickel transport system substrate-binding protein